MSSKITHTCITMILSPLCLYDGFSCLGIFPFYMRNAANGKKLVFHLITNTGIKISFNFKRVNEHFAIQSNINFALFVIS